MNLSLSARALVPAIAITAIAGLYFASTGIAEARTGSIELNRTASSTTASSTKPRSVDATCMSAAVDTRESAIITAWGDFNTSVTESLTERKAALIAAWSIDDKVERAKALKTAWSTWKTDKKAAHTELRGNRKVAWDTFKTTVKSECKVTLPKEEALEKSASDTIAL